MDSIIKDTTDYHISLLKIILFFIGKDIDLNKKYEIKTLNDIFIDLSKEDLNNNKTPQNIIQEEEKDDDDEYENNSNSQVDDEADDDDEEEEEYNNDIKVENNSNSAQVNDKEKDDDEEDEEDEEEEDDENNSNSSQLDDDAEAEDEEEEEYNDVKEIKVENNSKISQEDDDEDEDDENNSNSSQLDDDAEAEEEEEEEYDNVKEIKVENNSKISQDDDDEEDDDDENISKSSQLDEEAEAEEEEEYGDVKEIKVENNSKISQEDDDDEYEEDDENNSNSSQLDEEAEAEAEEEEEYGDYAKIESEKNYKEIMKLYLEINNYIEEYYGDNNIINLELIDISNKKLINKIKYFNDKIKYFSDKKRIKDSKTDEILNEIDKLFNALNYIYNTNYLILESMKIYLLKLNNIIEEEKIILNIKNKKNDLLNDDLLKDDLFKELFETIDIEKIFELLSKPYTNSIFIEVVKQIIKLIENIKNVIEKTKKIENEVKISVDDIKYENIVSELNYFNDSINMNDYDNKKKELSDQYILLRNKYNKALQLYKNAIKIYKFSSEYLLYSSNIFEEIDKKIEKSYNFIINLNMRLKEIIIFDIEKTKLIEETIINIKKLISETDEYINSNILSLNESDQNIFQKDISNYEILTNPFNLLIRKDDDNYEYKSYSYSYNITKFNEIYVRIQSFYFDIKKSFENKEIELHLTQKFNGVGDNNTIAFIKFIFELNVINQNFLKNLYNSDTFDIFGDDYYNIIIEILKNITFITFTNYKKCIITNNIDSFEQIVSFNFSSDINKFILNIKDIKKKGIIRNIDNKNATNVYIYFNDKICKLINIIIGIFKNRFDIQKKKLYYKNLRDFIFPPRPPPPPPTSSPPPPRPSTSIPPRYPNILHSRSNGRPR